MSKGLEAKNRLVNKCSEYLSLGIDHQVAEDFLTIEKELKENETLARKCNAYENFFKDVWHLIEKHNVNGVSGLAKWLEALEILKAFEFEIEDHTEELNGSVIVKCKRIILDDEEIDSLKEVLL